MAGPTLFVWRDDERKQTKTLPNERMLELQIKGGGYKPSQGKTMYETRQAKPRQENANEKGKLKTSQKKQNKTKQNKTPPAQG